MPLPHGTADRSAVLESLDRLARLYRLAVEALNARRASSAMTYAGFDMATQFKATIEAAIGLRLVNRDQPRFRYDT